VYEVTVDKKFKVKKSQLSLTTRASRAMLVARRLMTSTMTSRDYNVILVTSRYSKSSHSETRTISTVRVDPLSTHYRRTLCLNINSFGFELWKKKRLA